MRSRLPVTPSSEASGPARKVGLRLGSHSKLALIAALLAVTYAAVSLYVNNLNRALEWDEAVYMGEALQTWSEGGLGAHRARGIVWVVSVLVAFGGDSISMVRTSLVLIHATALGLAGFMWARLVGLGALLGGLIFGSLWLAIIYSAEVSPNLLAGLALLGATAAALLGANYQGRRRTWPYISLLLFALAALVRPTDSVWWFIGFAFAALVARLPLVRTMWPAAAGVGLGVLAWLIEAQARFDGPLERLRDAAALIDRTDGPHLLAHIRLLDGPLVGPDRITEISWWALAFVIALIGANIAGLALTWRTFEGKSLFVLLTAASFTGFSYIFLTGVLAPRFLIPMFLALSIGSGAALKLMWRKGGLLRTVGVLFAIVLAIGAGWQIEHAIGVSEDLTVDRAVSVRIAEHIIGRKTTTECFVYSQYAYPQIGFYSNCGGGQFAPTSSELPAELQTKLESGDVFVVSWIDPGDESPIDDWTLDTIAYKGSELRIYRHSAVPAS